MSSGQKREGRRRRDGEKASKTQDEGAEAIEQLVEDVRVAIIAGSKSDQPVVDDAVKALTELGVPHEVQFLSAHRNPEGLQRYVAGCKADVFIAVAGLAAHLPGVIASMTVNPVIGVPRQREAERARLSPLDSADAPGRPRRLRGDRQREERRRSWPPR